MYVFGILTIRETINSICVYIALQEAQLYALFYIFCGSLIGLLLHRISQKLIYEILIKRLSVHFVFVQITHYGALLCSFYSILLGAFHYVKSEPSSNSICIIHVTKIVID